MDPVTGAPTIRLAYRLGEFQQETMVEALFPLAQVTDSGGLTRGMLSDSSFYSGGELLTDFSLAMFAQSDSLTSSDSPDY